MKANLTNFESGWSGLALELSASEIEQLVAALLELKRSAGHIHYRSTFEGEPSIGDIEISCSGDEYHENLVLETARPIYGR